MYAGNEGRAAARSRSARCAQATTVGPGPDCTSPEPLALFWAEALHYVIAPPPSDFDSWDDFFMSIGVPEDELGGGSDIIEDSNGEGPHIWIQIVPQKKSIKNRIHIDVNASGGRGSSLDTGRELVEAEAARLVTSLGAMRLRANVTEGLDHYGVAMADPQGNEFDIN